VKDVHKTVANRHRILHKMASCYNTNAFVNSILSSKYVEIHIKSPRSCQKH